MPTRLSEIAQVPTNSFRAPSFSTTTQPTPQPAPTFAAPAATLAPKTFGVTTPTTTLAAKTFTAVTPTGTLAPKVPVTTSPAPTTVAFEERATTATTVPTALPGPMMTVTSRVPSGAARAIATPTAVVAPSTFTQRTGVMPRGSAAVVASAAPRPKPGEVGYDSGNPEWWPKEEASPPAPNGTTVMIEQPAPPPPVVEPTPTGGSGSGSGSRHDGWSGPPSLVDSAEPVIKLNPDSPLPVVDMSKSRQAAASDNSTSSPAVKYGLGGLALVTVGYFAFRQWKKKQHAP